MNCEKCQELIHDFLDGTITRGDESELKLHLDDCLSCTSVQRDLDAILGFCRTHRGEYQAPPNERALWLRIQNVIETDSVPVPEAAAPRAGFFSGWMKRSWELSLPQLSALAGVIVLVVSLVTVVGIRRWDSVKNTIATGAERSTTSLTSIQDRMWQRQQVINYWNQRIETNKVRWNPTMRETFERNLQVIDQAVNDSINELNRNPQDEVSEQMLNEALNDKLRLLQEFADL
jgi:hypothetical protein